MSRRLPRWESNHDRVGMWSAVVKLDPTKLAIHFLPSRRLWWKRIVLSNPLTGDFEAVLGVGRIDNVAFYNAVLPQSEIDKHFNKA